MLESVDFPVLERSVNRNSDLARIEGWWDGDDPNTLALFGRRRVGKSWLFRRFDMASLRSCLSLNGATRARNSSVSPTAWSGCSACSRTCRSAALFEVLYRLGQRTRWSSLTSSRGCCRARARRSAEALTSIQAVMEEATRPSCGWCCAGPTSADGEPAVREQPATGTAEPSTDPAAALRRRQRFMLEGLEAVSRSIATRWRRHGHVPRRLGHGGSLADRASGGAQRPGAVVQRPARGARRGAAQPGSTSRSSRSSLGRRSLGELAARWVGSRSLSPYLNRLREMEIVRGSSPVIGGVERDRRWEYLDPFLRFWFQFVFGMQDDLGPGCPPPTIRTRRSCRRWRRTPRRCSRTLPRSVASTASRPTGRFLVGPGAADLRRTHDATEEVDIVGVARNQVAGR